MRIWRMPSLCLFPLCLGVGLISELALLVSLLGGVCLLSYRVVDDSVSSLTI